MKKTRYAAGLAGLISLLVLSQAGAEEKLPSEKWENVNQVFEAAEVQVTEGRSPITEPYPYISTGSFSGPAVPESPDPLVTYRWPSPKATNGHHWCANAESYFLIGEAAGEGMKSLLK